MAQVEQARSAFYKKFEGNLLALHLRCDDSPILAQPKFSELGIVKSPNYQKNDICQFMSSHETMRYCLIGIMKFHLSVA